MLRNAISRWWETHKIYHTQLYQELWVGIALTGFVYYKISYGGKKKAVADKPSSAHH